MKPLQLTLRGFASFRQETTIPFEDLAEYQLFAIAGVTGSGKSSILDAISYALYGRTPRLGSTGLDEALLSQGADKIFVSFVFASEGATYRASRSVEWRVGRDGESKKGSPEVRIETGEAKDDGSLHWKILPESDKIRSAYSKIEHIVGLDYDGFTRAILLPQGAFSEFLRGEASQRRSLLMKLLGAERIAEMQKLAGQRASDAKKELAFLQQRLEQLTEATPKQQKDYQQQVASLEQQLTEGNGELEQRNRKLETMAALREFINEKQQLLSQEQQLRSQADAMQLLQTQVGQAQQAEQIQPQQQQYLAWQQRYEKAQSEAQQAQSIAEKASLELEHLQAQQAEMDAKQQQISQKESQVQALQQLQPQLEQLQREAGDRALLQEDLPETEAFAIETLENLKQLRYQLPTLRQRQQDKEASQAKLEAVTASLEPQQEAINQAQQQVAALREAATQQHDVLQTLVHTLEQAQIEADRGVHVAALREGLQLGDPCPFCGEALTSLPEVPENSLASLKKERKKQEKALDKAKQAFNQEREDYTSLVNQYQRNKDYASELAARVQDMQQQWQESRQIFATIAQEDATIATIEGSLQQSIAAQWQALAKQIQQQAQQAEVELELLHDDKALSNLQKAQKSLQKALETYQRNLQKAENGYTLAQRDVENAQKQRSEAQTELTQQQEKFQIALVQAEFADEAQWQAALMPVKARTQAQQELEDYHDACRQVQHRLEVVKASLEAAYVEDDVEAPEDYEASYQQALADKRQLEQSLQQMREDKGTLSAKLSQLEQDLAEKNAKEKEATKLKQRFSTFAQLNKDLQQKNFQAFMIGRMQQDLAQRAGLLMQEITNGRYRLYFDVANEQYSVADYWNGGDARDVRTLSGGETFIASLALALALSDAASNRSLEALFLDEGFGTLDSQTLESVTQILENLSQQGRMVGVITHVQELTERLPVRLQVRKSENGSTVRIDAP